MNQDFFDAALCGLLADIGMDCASLPIADGSEDSFLTAYATLGWHARDLGAVKRTGAPGSTLKELQSCNLIGVDAWSAADLARVILLRRRLTGLTDADAIRLMERVVRSGDLGEQAAALKGLMALPRPERFVATAVDAARAAATTIFRAVAQDNAYPYLHFPDHAFRSLVLKALHLGEPLDRIHGLAHRRDSQLTRMVLDYESELRHAGRPVSADFALVIERRRSP